MTKIQEFQGDSVPAKRLRALQEIVWESPGSLTLWVRAGFGKLYADLPTWADLLEKLCLDVQDNSERSLIYELIKRGKLQLAAEFMTDTRSDSLKQKICKIFDCARIDVEANPLKRLYPGTVITTNYDTILDRLFPEYRIIGPHDSIESIFEFQPKLVKLHGSVDDPDGLVLNVTSYAKRYDKEFEWFLAHIFQNTTVLFVGAGLSETEPYMRFIRLLSRAGLLRHHHYAVLPFPAMESESATNKAIRDRSNALETQGIRTLPFVVQSKADYKFVDSLLSELQPRTDDSVNRAIVALEKAMALYGPGNVGPAIFRLHSAFGQSHLEQRPFLNLTTSFLRALREQQRVDLGKQWKRNLMILIEYHEAQTRRVFEAEISAHPTTSSKVAEIAANKAFIYDLGPS